MEPLEPWFWPNIETEDVEDKEENEQDQDDEIEVNIIT